MNAVNPIVGKEAFENALKNVEQPFILVDFWADWCGPCRLIHPVLEKMNNEPEMQAKLKILQVNVDEPENRELSVDYQIMSIPNILFFGNDVEGKKYLVNRKVGAAPEPVFRDWLKREMENHEQKIEKTKKMESDDAVLAATAATTSGQPAEQTKNANEHAAADLDTAAPDAGSSNADVSVPDFTIDAD